MILEQVTIFSPFIYVREKAGLGLEVINLLEDRKGRGTKHFDPGLGTVLNDAIGVFSVFRPHRGCPLPAIVCPDTAGGFAHVVDATWGARQLGRPHTGLLK